MVLTSLWRTWQDQSSSNCGRYLLWLVVLTIVVGVLTFCALLHSMCVFRTTLIQKLRHYEFKLEATKSISCAENEGAVNHTTVTRWFKKSHLNCKNLDGILGAKQSMTWVLSSHSTCNTHFWPFLRLDGWLERPHPLRWLLCQTFAPIWLSTNCILQVALIANKHPTLIFLNMLEDHGWGSYLLKNS